MGKRAPDQNDKAIGARVRIARLGRGMSQTELADKLGVTFQQVQKYENGTNRVSAGRLLSIADILKQPVLYFYQDCKSATATFAKSADDPLAPLTSRQGMQLSRAFGAIHDADARAAIVASAEAFAALSDPAFARRKAA